MNTPLPSCLPSHGVWLLRFPSLFDEGRGLAFPCDATGRVDVDSLSERARANFLGAHSRVGREFATPLMLLAGQGTP